MAGACDFPARPSLNALEQPVFWTPETDTSVLHIGAAPGQPQTPRVLADLDTDVHRASSEGLHISVFTESGRLHLIALKGLWPGQPIAAVIPIDAHGLDRAQSLTRLLRSLYGLAVPKDTRMTAQQRRRLKNMMRAVDGRMNDADYRQIAEAIFGVERVASDPWKTSALRDAVIDLVKDGFAMIDSGYRKLLRHRRRS
ncbi:DUF2285 domain-containing protein [Pseudaminobacter sp. NGMCC 1.201702]|uniref:DUF2285 domain-containing protein n=1 Tax=Pseudaminobacter sp. NGMCC 1.201702 TaxID=3391825 RepID=UPI0039F0D308